MQLTRGRLDDVISNNTRDFKQLQVSCTGLYIKLYNYYFIIIIIVA